MDLGTPLRRLRDQKNLSTRIIADRMGISHSTYISWENNKSAPSLNLFFDLSNAFNAEPITLLAYLTGKTSKVLSLDEIRDINAFNELMYFSKSYSELLKENISLLQAEIHQLKQNRT